MFAQVYVGLKSGGDRLVPMLLPLEVLARVLQLLWVHVRWRKIMDPYHPDAHMALPLCCRRWFTTWKIVVRWGLEEAQRVYAKLSARGKRDPILVFSFKRQRSVDHWKWLAFRCQKRDLVFESEIVWPGVTPEFCSLSVTQQRTAVEEAAAQAIQTILFRPVPVQANHSGPNRASVTRGRRGFELRYNEWCAVCHAATSCSPDAHDPCEW